MILIGLTGSIGMGKSTTAALFAEAGAPVYDADAAVHAFYAPGSEAGPLLASVFPDAVGRDGGVDRQALSARVKTDAAALPALEAVVHPLVAADRTRFLQAAKAAGARAVVLDIPLLFETGGETGVDVVVVVSAPAAVQRQRVLARPGMDPEKLQTLLARQTSDADKRARADYVIDTGSGLERAREQVRAILAEVLQADGKPT